MNEAPSGRPEIEISIVMPCLNEKDTLETCIAKAKIGLTRCGRAGEIIVADNGSTDGSAQIALDHGARVVPAEEKGYGSALKAGISSARGDFIVMGDADDSYDFSDLQAFVQKLNEGYDLVMGCRFPKGGGRIVPGAMPRIHRLGTPFFSLLGRWLYGSTVSDIFCGLRAFHRKAYERMELQCNGMEFAAEMAIAAARKKMRVGEVPVTLHKDGRRRPPHLKTFHDGWKILRMMLFEWRSSNRA